MNKDKLTSLTFILLILGFLSSLAFSTDSSASDLQTDTFKRYFIASDLRDPNLGPEYKQLLAGEHWANIAEWMHSQGVIDLEIYLLQQRLAMIFETKPDFHLQTFKDSLHALPLYKDWQQIMKRFLKPLPQAEEGEAWVLTERVYELEQKEEYRNVDGYVKKRFKIPTKRICEARELVTDPNLLQKYKDLHAIGMAWPEITQSIKDSGVLELEIYMVGNRTFEFNIVPLDFDWDAALEGSEPSEKEKEWGAIMGPIDKPFTDKNGHQLKSQVMESIFKSTRNKSSIPYVATRNDTIKDMLWMANVGKDDIVYDLGSGDGRSVIAAVRDFGARRAVGIEKDPERIRESWDDAREAEVADRVEFIQGDLFAINFSEASVVTMFLGHNANIKLRPKIFRTLKPGTRIVSHQFSMGEWQTDKTQTVRMVYMGMFATAPSPFYKNPKVPDYTGNESYGWRSDKILMWVVPVPVAGIWQGKINTTQGTQNLQLILHQRLSEVTGRFQLSGQTNLEGHVSVDLWGNHLRFWGRPKNTPYGQCELRFDGHVHEKKMEGTLAIKDHDQLQEFQWQAQRDKVDYTGTWQWPCASGERSVSLLIEKKNGYLTATYLDQDKTLPVHNFYDFGGGFYFTLLIGRTEHGIRITEDTGWLVGEGIIDKGQLIGKIEFYPPYEDLPNMLGEIKPSKKVIQDWTPSLIKP
ncbi:MAG: L-rhamnose mutarotase [Planctomycetota bacterium]|jgi:L-rhamnose mutarotase/precorrin-6B methylase 2